MQTMQLHQQAFVTELGLSGQFTHVEEALTHPSYSNEQRKGSCADNQRLEFLGDAVLGLCVTDALMARFPDADEGALSRMRSSLVNAEALSTWARSVNLGAVLRMGRGALAAGEHERTNVLADAVEALVGAVYLDRGLEEARRLAHVIVEQPLSRLCETADATLDPKSELQERVQAAGGQTPRYRTVRVEGPAHEREFFVVVEVGSDVIGEGRGRSKKLAELDAARSALLRSEATHGSDDAAMPSEDTDLTTHDVEVVTRA